MFFILHYTGKETFELPTGDNLWGLLINMSLDLILNLSILIGVQVTSPLFISLGIPSETFYSTDFISRRVAFFAYIYSGR